MSLAVRKSWMLIPVVFVSTEVLRAADPAAAKTAAKVILEKGWDNTPAARSTADREFDAAKAAAPDDPYLLSAHWMAMANQNRYDAALGSINALLERYPHYVPALRAKVWIHTVMKDYRQALAAAEVLAKAIGRNPTAANAASGGEHDEAADFLGRLTAFLETPMEGAFDPVRRKQFEAQTLGQFDESRKRRFTEGKESVLIQFEALKKAASDVAEDSKKLAEAEKQKKLEGLEKEKDQIAEKAQQVQEREKKAEQQLKETLDNLNRYLSSAAARITQLQNHVTVLHQQLTREQAASAAARSRAAQAKDDRRLQSEAQRTVSLERGTQRQIDNLNLQIGETKAVYGQIQQQIQVAKAGGDVQIQQLANQLNNLAQENKRNESRQKRTENAKKGTKTGALDSKARSFSTYAILPLEELRSTLRTKLY